MNSQEISHPANRDKLPIFEAVLAERMLPTATKAMGFQSYEKLGGDPEYRKAEQQAFLAGEIRNPVLDYPLIDEEELLGEISSLDIIISQAEYLSDPKAREVVQASAAYRQCEMYMVLMVKKLDELKDEPTSPAFIDLAQRYQELNEILYGKPDEELSGQIYGEIAAQLEEKEFVGKLRDIYNEYMYGFSIEVAGETVVVPGVAGRENGRLPKITPDDLVDLKEVVLERYPFILPIAQQYWDEEIEDRPVKEGKEKGFSPEDMKVVFDRIIEHLDPDGTLGVSSEITGGTALSWDSPSSKVQIGSRRKEITSPKVMGAKSAHEAAVHAGRMIAGIRSKLAVLGTGMISNGVDGLPKSYLAFEEGFATMVELAVENADEIKWEALHISRYLAVMSLYEGHDYRQTYERNWRARVLIEAKSGVAMSDADIERQQKQADVSVTRVKRGTPSAVVSDLILSFNKDLSYLPGKVQALNYLRSIKGNKAAVERLFSAKFDPTDPTQDALVDKYGS